MSAIEPSGQTEPRLPVSPQLALRVAIIGGLVMTMFAIIFFRLWYLQVLSSASYVKQAQSNQVRDVTVQAPRGDITDRTGQTLVRVVFFGALAGLLIVLLAMRGVLRFLFALWSLTVVVLLVRGYLLSGYHFAGPDEFRFAMYLLGGAILSLPGALQVRGPRSTRKR